MGSKKSSPPPPAPPPPKEEVIVTDRAASGSNEVAAGAKPTPAAPTKASTPIKSSDGMTADERKKNRELSTGSTGLSIG